MLTRLQLFAIACLAIVLGGCVTTSGVTVPSTNYYDKKVIDLHPEVFRVPGEARHPTVVVLHGSGGVDMHHRDWARLINSWGYNAVAFDSFRPRGVSDLNGKAFEVPFLQRALDAEVIARWIKTQPWSTDKICVVGFSHGGVSVLAIAMDGYLSAEIKTQHSFKCGVDYYGVPMTDMFFSDNTIPMQIHLGSKDGSNDINRNKDFAKKYNKSVQLFIYEGAEHGFDRVATDITVRGQSGFVQGSYYKIKSDTVAREQSVQEVKKFLDQQLN